MAAELAAEISVNGAVDPTLVAQQFIARDKSLDVTFILFSGYLVFFMQAGFAMLTAGSVRSKNTKNVLLKNVLDACVGSLAYFVFGYAFACVFSFQDTPLSTCFKSSNSGFFICICAFFLTQVFPLDGLGLSACGVFSFYSQSFFCV